MEQAELGDAMERFLEMHMYITSALQKSDMKAVTLQLAMDLVHQMVQIINFIFCFFCEKNFSSRFYDSEIIINKMMILQ